MHFGWMGNSCFLFCVNSSSIIHPISVFDLPITWEPIHSATCQFVEASHIRIPRAEIRKITSCVAGPTRNYTGQGRLISSFQFVTNFLVKFNFMCRPIPLFSYF
ncbi:hypothetical protein L6164_024182 [Bauhinia variegata]|uniref:Uncharacterized protein n=1 Tax=Bauhinia variegata TaxID=167791 RepID=A0ACB9LX12_BAUVA|nr:hypothetical protein L6164_024182 [Bauhinia variegata]